MQKALALLLCCAAIEGCTSFGTGAPVRVRPYNVLPDSPSIGSNFKLVVDGKAAIGDAPVTVPDGTYTVVLSTAIETVPTNGDLTTPTTATEPNTSGDVEIGTIVIKDGKGEADFTLKADYGNGIMPQPGNPASVKFSNAAFSGTAGFRIGGK